MEQEEYISRATLLHGNTYDYSKTHYLDAKEKVTVTCRLHGDFEVVAHKHSAPSSKSGCQICGKEKIRLANIRRGEKSFIDKSPIIHNGKYNYDKFIYEKSNHKSIITCPEHKDFLMSPNTHLSGAGCPECANIKKRNPKSKITKSEFITKSKALFKDKYSYPEDCFVSRGVAVNIICPTHGKVSCAFYTHIGVGTGCPLCNKEVSISKMRASQEDFISSCKIEHDNYYTYEDTVYKKSLDNIDVTCPIHGVFTIRAGHHKYGTGCSKCGRVAAGEKLTGFYNVTTIERNRDILKEQNNNIYVFKLKEGIYKIGIAMQVKNRLSCVKMEIGGYPEIVYNKSMSTYKAFYVELDMHTKLKDFRYFSDTPWTGHTEVFSLTELQLKDVITLLGDIGNE